MSRPRSEFHSNKAGVLTEIGLIYERNVQFRLHSLDDISSLINTHYMGNKAKSLQSIQIIYICNNNNNNEARKKKTFPNVILN